MVGLFLGPLKGHGQTWVVHVSQGREHPSNTVSLLVGRLLHSH